MKNGLVILLCVSLMVFFAVPVYGQQFADHIIINEVDTNPPGDDWLFALEWVELYNPSDSAVDIGGWEIASTTLNRTLVIQSETVVNPGEFLKFSHVSGWFADVNDTVRLLNDGVVVDATPLITDLQNDLNSWQRIYDGLDSDSTTDWKFDIATLGVSNGKIPQIETKKETTISISSDKQQYVFGDIAVLQGSISEAAPAEDQYRSFDPVTLVISGPNYKKTQTLYPDADREFGTTLSLQRVLGITEGTFSVMVSYSGVTSQTTFAVEQDMRTFETSKNIGTLSLLTDKSEYLPGQSVLLTGNTDVAVQLDGLKYTVYDPQGAFVTSGVLFPAGGKFSTNVYLSTINPIYGTYKITATYSDVSSDVSFDLIPDSKEDVIISLDTDKDAYGLGDVVTITGRLNNLWTATLDLQINQAKNIAHNASGTGGGSTLKILDVVRLDGDGRFQYEFSIPDADTRLGDYAIMVYGSVGSATKSIIVVENPDEYVVSDLEISLVTDQSVYGLGDMMTIGGKIANPVIRSNFETPPVMLSISGMTETGMPAQLHLTAIPDLSGRFSVETLIPQPVFSAGPHIVEAKYEGLSESISVEFIDIPVFEGAAVSIDKQVYGLDETLTLTGTLPPRGENTVTISITKPDGTVIHSGATVDNQRFSWQWQTPVSERYQSIKGAEDRSTSTSNFGVYHLKVSSDAFSKIIPFKISKDPENDSLSEEHVLVGTSKPVYRVDEVLKVMGSVITSDRGQQGLSIPDRVSISIQPDGFKYPRICNSSIYHEQDASFVSDPLKRVWSAYCASVYPDQGGSFESSFELPATIFEDGKYTIKVVYSNISAEATFDVVSDFTTGTTGDVELLLSTNSMEYNPGDLVTISGKPSKLVYPDRFNINIIKQVDGGLDCGSTLCGNSESKIDIAPSPSGLFIYEFKLDATNTAVGMYEVVVDAEFETKSVTFKVVPTTSTEEPTTSTDETTPSATQPEPKTFTIIEKENRIPDSSIDIPIKSKTSPDGYTMNPRVLSGSMLTPLESDQSDVNLMVLSESGVCVIGPDCLVQDSTRKPGTIYDVVIIDGTEYNVRYSGPDVRLERFDILPKDAGEFLPDETWTVKILKDEQPSRFYYKINYKAS